MSKFYGYSYTALTSVLENVKAKGTRAVASGDTAEASRLRVKYAEVAKVLKSRIASPLHKLCRKCGGTGYVGMYDRVEGGRCYGCGGCGTVKGIAPCQRCGKLFQSPDGSTICAGCWTVEDQAGADSFCFF